MKSLQERIAKEAVPIGTDMVKVDTFLNYQLDVDFLNEIGREFKRRFEKETVTKILTVESSGIAIATIAAQYFNVPVVIAKKNTALNQDEKNYVSEVFSFTHQRNYVIRVAKKFIHPEDCLLIIDDFLAQGKAIVALNDIIGQARAQLTGVGIVIEKAFQPGGKFLRSQGIKIESLAVINSIENGQINFA